MLLPKSVPPLQSLTREELEKIASMRPADSFTEADLRQMIENRDYLISEYARHTALISRRLERAERALTRAGWTYTEGAEEWKPPVRSLDLTEAPGLSTPTNK